MEDVDASTFASSYTRPGAVAHVAQELPPTQTIWRSRSAPKQNYELASLCPKAWSSERQIAESRLDAPRLDAPWLDGDTGKMPTDRN